MTETPTFPVTVFYDGSCSVCAAEMDHYRAKNHGGRLIFIDVSADRFDPARYGKTLEEFMAQMYVLDAQGRFYRGVDAFAEIWRTLPGSGYRLLAGLIMAPGLHLLARLGYWLFARFRQFLPKTGKGCDGDSCSLDRRR